MSCDGRRAANGRFIESAIQHEHVLQDHVKKPRHAFQSRYGNTIVSSPTSQLVHNHTTPKRSNTELQKSDYRNQTGTLVKGCQGQAR
jgi:hypothetical protein